MDLEKEVFKVGEGQEHLALIFTPQIARAFINQLEAGISEYQSDFYYYFQGSCHPNGKS